MATITVLKDMSTAPIIGLKLFDRHILGTCVRHDFS